jgi:hypothetical protein
MFFLFITLLALGVIVGSDIFTSKSWKSELQVSEMAKWEDLLHLSSYFFSDVWD